MFAQGFVGRTSEHEVRPYRCQESSILTQSRFDKSQEKRMRRKGAG